MLRACLTCGAPTQGRRCPQHTPVATNPANGRSEGRDRTQQHHFRQAVLTRDHYTCACGHHDPTGRTLRSCHVIPFVQQPTYAPSAGITRCIECDRNTDRYAT